MSDNDNGGATVAPNVNWDDSEMISTYANVCNASSTREEVMLFFGTNQTWNPAQAQSEVNIKLTNRMVLSPFAAKRLNLILANVVAEYEAAFGQLNLEVGQGLSSQAEDAHARTN